MRYLQICAILFVLLLCGCTAESGRPADASASPQEEQPDDFVQTRVSESGREISFNIDNMVLKEMNRYFADENNGTGKKWGVEQVVYGSDALWIVLLKEAGLFTGADAESPNII